MSPALIRVLVVVDDPACRAAIHEALDPDDACSLTMAGTGREAVAALDTAGHDLIVLELDLPDARGLASVALVRAHADGRPIIALADPWAEATALKAVQAGCADYMLKGQLYPTVVSRTIRHAVESWRAEQRRDRTERALVESEQRYRSLFEQSRDAIYMTTRDGEILELNHAAGELLGHDPDDLLGRDVLSLYADPADRQRFRHEIEASGQVRDFEVRLLRSNGSDCWCLVSAWVTRDQDGAVTGYQGIIHDITRRKQTEDRLTHEAFHDALTGLPNRALFMDRLERAVARRRRGEERELAVLFLDLDRFKVVNDSLGHVVGDDLLRHVAGMLRGEIREEDTVARLGGDEFAILLDGVDDAADATHVAERIQERLRKPFRVGGHDVFTSVSIGITFGGADIEKAEHLLRDADTAMYRAKEMGPARYQIFDQAMHAHAVTLLQLETDLRLALERSEFVIHYQPVLGIDDRRLLGFEALVRWLHPSRGLLAPQSFIPVAEDTGAIVPLGEWVLRGACRQLRSWQEVDPGRKDLFVSVNLSARQFSQPDLFERVREILWETGLQGRSLRLELTESALMQHQRTSLQTLKELRSLGVGLCLDDFGTGFSSLGYLHHFPVDTLKIDRTFIERLKGSAEGNVVGTIVALARSLGLDAIAEGVETEEQLQRLRDLGPSSVQGFLFSTPLDSQAASKLLDEALPVTRV